ncbi:MAG TPA: histidine triad nucleotide-binding protein [Gammaproteobacteria bacterium]|jgi:histidine triad (HIT) family protein|nr:histidine triad nucleotide-binding protein [Gammaproteobacteria bacterium]HAY41900.1 histidine triad nucleotide-binding protein [Gammaproteobacteria bacterium]|tara:strand:+ start:376 stop:714 length:339 start_codon:yes stop_codon:yes gene_type:complete
MSDCIFCSIINGDIPAEKVYEDEEVFAFNDIASQAPYHFLVIPKRHISTLNDTEDEKLIGKLSLTASRIAKQKGFAEDGYRVVMNTNKDGAQTVFHVHLHCLAGRQLGWPPG